MNEAEALALHLGAEGWQLRLKKELDQAVKKTPTTGPDCDPAATIEELLGKEIRDAILNDVVS